MTAQNRSNLSVYHSNCGPLYLMMKGCPSPLPNDEGLPITVFHTSPCSRVGGVRSPMEPVHSTLRILQNLSLSGGPATLGRAPSLHDADSTGDTTVGKEGW